MLDVSQPYLASSNNIHLVKVRWAKLLSSIIIHAGFKLCFQELCVSKNSSHSTAKRKSKQDAQVQN